MAILKIATIGHPVLRQVARPLTRDELRSEKVQRFIDDLVDTMHDANGAGLAANQVYEPIRITAIEVNKNPRYPYKPNYPLTILVNPVVTPLPTDPSRGSAPTTPEGTDLRSGYETFLNYEGCLSVPNLRGQVRRFTHVRVQAWDRHGNDLDLEIKGLTAGTFQHEVDHLDGKVFLDRVEDTTTLATWADFERFHMAGFVARARALVERYGS